MKKIFLTPIKWYQAYSRLRPASCRYYPTCSEYAKWLYMFDNPLSATLKSAKRIATCNQLFPGGIDYPKVKMKHISLLCLKNRVFNQKESKIRIRFWLIPKKKHLLIVKDFDATPTYIPARYAPSFAPR